MTHDYSQFTEAPSEDALTKLADLARKLRTAELAVDTLEDQLKAAKERVRVLSEQSIPELMEQCGNITKIGVDGVGEIHVKDEMRASFPKDAQKQEAAYNWLKEHGHDDLVKREFVVKFGKGEDEWANEFEQKLREESQKRPLKVDKRKSIHHQTLLAFLREQTEEGSGVPLPLFGAIVQRMARIK